MTHALRFAAAIGLAALCASAQAQDSLATLRATRYVSLSTGGKSQSVRSGQSAATGSELSTGRRSFAEAQTKGATLRLNERSRLTLTDAESVQLQSGALFVRGTVRVGTEGALVVVNNGTAVIEILKPGVTRVSSLGGAVEVEQDEARATLKPKENITMERTSTRKLRGTPDPISGGDLPTEANGPWRGWWHQIDDEDGLMVFPGSSSAYALRTDPISEAITNIAAIPPRPQEVAENADRRQTLLNIAAAHVTPTIDEALAANPQLTLQTYRQLNAANYIEDQFKLLTQSDRDFLRNNGLRTVDQLFTGLTASGGGFGPGVALLKNDYRMFDRNADKMGYFLGGALASLALGGKVTWSAPRARAAAYGFLSDPQAFGLRAELIGAAGKTSYHIEGNSLSLTGGDQTPSQTDALSQAVVERELSGGMTVFAGRRRFYSGPLLQDHSLTQLLADRYTGVGVRQRAGKSVAEVAFLSDANPNRRGSQSGALASLTTRSGGGLFSVQVLNAAKVTGGGTGVSFAISQPMGAFDGYGEVGQSVEGRTVATVGVYLSSLFQKTGVDAWVEAGTNPGYADTLSLGVAKTVNDLTWRAFGTLNKPKGLGQNGKWGFGAVYRYK
ncbi:MAG: hypothetical protein QM758_10510 [Armatimonas sp.]